MFSVMIADPEPLVREGIKQILGTCPDVRVCCEASDVPQTLQLLHDCEPDVLILEIAMAGHGGVRIVHEIMRSHPRLRILVVSHRGERNFALRAFRAGAAGFFNKECADEELVDAVLTVAQGRPYVNETVSELLAESVAGGHARLLHEQLSDSDFEIFCMIAGGIPTTKVAAICHVTPGAIRSRRNKMMEKMLLRTDADVVQYAVRHNLIDRSYPH